MRGWLGAGDVVNTDSGAYGWGEIGGTVYSMVLPGPKGLKAVDCGLDAGNKVPGIYRGIGKNGLPYWGESGDLINRIRKGHHALDLEYPVDFFPMPGKTKLERRIAEARAIAADGGPREGTFNKTWPINKADPE